MPAAAPEFLFGPTPHTEAMDFIASKPLVSREVFAGLLPELKARAFTVAGVENANVLSGIRAKLAQLPAGVPWDKLKRQIADDLHPYLADPEDPENRIAAERRAELLLRTHGFQAYQAAAYEVGERQADVFPFLQYVSMGDGKVRPAHAALDGVVLPRAHEFWRTHTPPWEWGCRCQAIPISADDHADLVKADEKKPEDKKNVLNEYAQQDLTATRRLVRNGVSYNVSSPAEKGKPGAFRSHPGDLRLSLEDLRARYDAQTWAEFQAWAQKQPIAERKQTVWEWLNGAVLPPSASPTLPVAPIANFASVLSALGLTNKVVWAEQDVSDILAKLKKPGAVPVAQKLLSITGAKASGPFSQKELKRAMQDMLDLLPPGVAQQLPAITIDVRKSISGALGDYNPSSHVLRLNHASLSLYTPEAQRETLWHELMHWVHLHGPQGYRDAITDHFRARTAGEPLVTLGGYSCTGKKDRWWDAYAGRIYGWAGETGTEVPTRYFQLFANPKKFLRQLDPTANPHAGSFLETVNVVMGIFV